MQSGTFLTLLIALLIEAAIGYPDAVFMRIGHPVTWIGSLITVLDHHLNREHYSPLMRKAGGVVALLSILAASIGVALALRVAFQMLPFGRLAEAIAASSLIASRSLYAHVRDVTVALATEGTEAGRRAVSRIVGRDPNSLDKHGVARAAIESLAENASDGVVAPVFWFAVLGLPGLAAYKAINTADSMIGHRTARHEAFGWASARLDDLVNLPASRSTAALLVLASSLSAKASPLGALRAIFRDAGRHRSPNAGWPESAMAGALGLKLAGPRSYGGVLVQDAYMGNGRANANANDIKRALRLADVAWSIMFTGIAALWFFTARG